MKILKKAAVLCLCAAVVCVSGCSDKNSDDEKNGKDNKKETTLTQQLSDKLGGGEYSVDTVISGGEYGEGMKYSIKAKDGNGIVTMVTGNVKNEFYTVDEKTYMLMPDIGFYRQTDIEGGLGNIFLKVGEEDIPTKTETKNGEITEVYQSSFDNSGETIKEKTEFVYDEKTKELKSMTSSSGDDVFKVEVNSIDWTCEDISLPDLKDWTDFSSGDISEEDEVCYQLYSDYGITKKDVSASGYSYEKLSKMSEDERKTAANGILKKSLEEG